MAETFEGFLKANGWRPGLPADGSDQFARNTEIARERARKARQAKRQPKTGGQA